MCPQQQKLETTNRKTSLETKYTSLFAAADLKRMLTSEAQGSFQLLKLKLHVFAEVKCIRLRTH